MCLELLRPSPTKYTFLGLIQGGSYKAVTRYRAVDIGWHDRCCHSGYHLPRIQVRCPLGIGSMYGRPNIPSQYTALYRPYYCMWNIGICSLGRDKSISQSQCWDGGIELLKKLKSLTRIRCTPTEACIGVKGKPQPFRRFTFILSHLTVRQRWSWQVTVCSKTALLFFICFSRSSCCARLKSVVVFLVITSEHMQHKNENRNLKRKAITVNSGEF